MKRILRSGREVSDFKIKELPVEGLKLVEYKRVRDIRGSFEKYFAIESFSKFGWIKPIAQINRSQNFKKGTIRGLHFQYPPYNEMKLVICLKGKIWDVAVDLRKGSRSFLRWHGEFLSEDEPKAMLIPEGFAHGFQTLSDEVELLYLHSAPYMPESEGGINPFDPRLGISWPLPVSVISERDKNLPLLEQNFVGIEL